MITMMTATCVSNTSSAADAADDCNDNNNDEINNDDEDGVWRHNDDCDDQDSLDHGLVS